MAVVCELCREGPNPILGERIESWTGKAHVNCIRLLRPACYYDKDKYTSQVTSKTAPSKCDFCGKVAALAKCRDLNCTSSFHLSCVIPADGSIEFEKLVIMCKEHKCKKFKTKLGKCCKCNSDVVDREGFLLLCCSSHLHVKCARDLISSNSDTCPSCMNKEDYEIDLQMNGVYVPATQHETQFIQQFTKCIQESKDEANHVMKNKSSAAKTNTDKAHNKAINGLSYKAKEASFASNASMGSSGVIDQFTKVTEKRDAKTKDKKVIQNGASSFEAVTIHTDDSDTGSCSSIISINSSHSGRSSRGRRRTEKWVTRNTQKLTIPQARKDDINNTGENTICNEKDDVISVISLDATINIYSSGPNSPASSISNLNSPRSSYSNLNSPRSSYSNLNSPRSSCSNLNSPVRSPKGSVSSNVGLATKKSEEAEGMTMEDSNQSHTVEDRNHTQTVNLDDNIEELDVEASQNMSKQISQNITQFKPNRQSSNLVMAGITRLGETRIEPTKTYSMDINSVFHDEFCDDEMKDAEKIDNDNPVIDESANGDVDLDGDHDHDGDDESDQIDFSVPENHLNGNKKIRKGKYKNLTKKSPSIKLSKSKKFSSKSAKQIPIKVKGDSKRFELTNTSDKSESRSKLRKRSGELDKEKLRSVSSSIEDLDQNSTERRKSRLSAERAKESLKSRKSNKIAKDQLNVNQIKGKRKRLSIENNQESKKARLSLEKNNKSSSRSTANDSIEEAKVTSSQKKKKKCIVSKSISERFVLHSRNGVPWNQSTQPFLPECYDGVPQLIRNNIKEFVDVNKGEKRILELWNDFIIREKSAGFVHLPELCAQFININGALMIREKLYRNCLLHFTDMEQSGLIDCNTHIRLVGQIQTYVEEEEAIKTDYLDDLLKDPEDETDTSDTTTATSDTTTAISDTTTATSETTTATSDTTTATSDTTTAISDTTTANSSDAATRVLSTVITSSTSQNSVLKTDSDNPSNEDHIEYLKSVKVLDKPSIEDHIKDDPDGEAFIDPSCEDLAENNLRDKDIVNSPNRDSTDYNICDTTFVNNLNGDDAEHNLSDKDIENPASGEWLEDIDLERATEMNAPIIEEVMEDDIDKTDEDLNQMEASNESLESGKDYLADISSNYENRMDHTCSKKGQFENSSTHDFGAAFKRFLSERSKGAINF